jgi:class 3 adenylate cyclase
MSVFTFLFTDIEGSTRLWEADPAVYGEPTDAFDYLTMAIRHFDNAGSFSHLRVSLAVLATVFDRLGHHEPAATISAFATTPLTRTSVPEIHATISHLREVLGDEVYESLIRTGESMTSAEMATYALDQIEQARAGLLRADGST